MRGLLCWTPNPCRLNGACRSHILGTGCALGEKHSISLIYTLQKRCHSPNAIRCVAMDAGGWRLVAKAWAPFVRLLAFPFPLFNKRLLAEPPRTTTGPGAGAGAVPKPCTLLRAKKDRAGPYPIPQLVSAARPSQY